MSKKALVTGITGQDGSYLAELLIDKGYEVHGLLRRTATENTHWLANTICKNGQFLIDGLTLHYCDMTDSSSLIRLVIEIRPDEIYNLAAQSHVKVSFDVPEYTADTDGIGTLRILEAVRIAGLSNSTRIYQASTSELFGLVQETPQCETTPFYPRSPYGCAKLYAYWIVKNYREAYGMFAANGILFNHESERRNPEFVTRKITIAAAKIAAGLQDKLLLGNLNAKRDWGYAADYVECMWLMLQADAPEDYVIATGSTHSVKEFCELAFAEVGIPITWQGQSMQEKGLNSNSGEVIIAISPEFYRPTDVEFLLGDPTKAKQMLGWNPLKTTFEELVRKMIKADVELLNNK